MLEMNPQCVRCKHKFMGELSCSAFPEGIPPEMFADLEREPFDHRYPFPGDHGVQWAPAHPGEKHPAQEIAE